MAIKRTILVDIEDLIIESDLRTQQDLDAGFSASISSSGVIQPLIVTKAKDGRYIIIDGRRRYRHALALGMTQIEATVMVAETYEERLLLQIESNRYRQDWTALDMSRIVSELMTRCGWTQEHTAESLGLKQAQVSQYLGLLRMAPEAQELVSEGTLEFSSARELCRLNDNPDAQRAACAEIRRRSTERQAKRTGGKITYRQTANIVARVRQPLEKIQREHDLQSARALERQIAAQPAALASVTDSDEMAQIDAEGGDFIAAEYLKLISEACEYLSGIPTPTGTVGTLWAEARARATAWLSQSQED